MESYLRGLVDDRSSEMDTWGLTWNAAGKPSLALPEAKRGKALMELNFLLHRALVRCGADVNWTTLLVGSSSVVAAPGPPVRPGLAVLAQVEVGDRLRGELDQVCSSLCWQVPRHITDLSS